MGKKAADFKWVLYVCAGAVGLYLLLPLLMIILTSVSMGASTKFPPEGLTLEWYGKLADQKQFLQAFLNSIAASAGAVALALVAGTLAALAIIQYPFRGSGVLRAFFMSPMVMPKITLGVAYLILFSKMHIAGGLFALILGEAVIVLPFVLSIVGSAMANLNAAHREAAADLGAGPFRIFFTVTLPQLRLSLLLAGSIAFVFTFDQVETALLILRQGSYTLPIQLFLYMEKWQDPTVAVVSVVLIAFALTLFFAIKLVIRSAPGLENLLGSGQNKRRS
ncbi:ABC transporter permease [Paenibacillus radicis (ex Gao et al. 2016)]|uniref:Polyamine ABC transporter permease n=1 Tax=Paenibacillus radicis (ex Gao et al. 2016) TaxID=1737354 RepID=A0A917HPW1_9BACL|nr:ABC transporter permease subunit [Paenibacillus radicis (ex Gao et al. 2016)]GGG85588.1 polyamine ABC transporter permease [Paenibacillus radicis (ex Gao et al. 2016)]